MPKSKDKEDQSFNGAPSCRYSRITQHTKDKLCYVVKSTSTKVGSAAKILKINPSTAKLIIRKFNEMPIQEQEKVMERGAKSKKQKTDGITPRETVPIQSIEQSIKQMLNKNQVKCQEKQVVIQEKDKKEQKQDRSQKTEFNYVYIYYPFVPLIQ